MLMMDYREHSPLIPASFPIGRAWYVASVAPKSELIVMNAVKRSGLDAYVPRSQHIRFNKKFQSRGHVERALFPGYVFLHFDVERDDWFGVVSGVPEVREILSNLTVPMRVNTIDISRLQRAEQAGVFDYTRPSAAFAIGDAVEVKEGPLAGMIGKIRSASAKRRIKVLLKFLGGDVPFQIDPCFLARVSV